MKGVSKHLILISSLCLFLIFLPLINKVNFMQNDDWNRTTSVERFLKGDFSLLPVTATTFYTQGILGTVFASVFGMSKLPYLTLIVSVLNFFFFAMIVEKFFRMSKFSSIVNGLILFFNPLHMYSSIGFMTENYTLLMVLISLFFFLQYEQDRQSKFFLFSNLFSVLGFFCKQNAVVLTVSILFYFLVRKKYKEALVQFLTVSGLLLFYFLAFPKTPEMADKGLILNHLSDFGYTFSLIYGILIVTTSFVAGIVLQAIINAYRNTAKTKKRYLNIALLLTLAVTVFLLFGSQFKPGKISWEEYPYFENTFERTGFLPRTVQGTKYHFTANYDLFKYWDGLSKIILCLTIASFILYRKKVVNLYSIYLFGYLLLMVFTSVFFDRYILNIIPFAILFFLYVYEINDTKIFKLVTTVFALFLIFFSTQLAIDFVVTHNYIWSKSNELVLNGTAKDDIFATGAWKKVNGISRNYKYLFTYDSPEKNPELSSTFNLIEKHPTHFPGSIFVDPAIYLYIRK